MNKEKIFELGLIGYPVSHSLSPLLHNSALQALGLRGNYRLFPISPLPDGEHQLIKLLSKLSSGELTGLNVTIPHKRAIIPLLDNLTDLAQAANTVNTVVWQDGNLLGDNTDTQGFLTDLYHFLNRKSLTFEDESKIALVIGAGGSAGAVCLGLIKDGWQVVVAARRLEQAQRLAAELGTSLSSCLHPISLCAEEVATIFPDLIVNTTPVGMSPDINQSPWPAGLTFPNSAVVYDLIYNPPDTLFIKQARKAGLSATNGIGMLIEQAALSFQLWTGAPSPRKIMWNAFNNTVVLQT